MIRIVEMRVANDSPLDAIDENLRKLAFNRRHRRCLSREAQHTAERYMHARTDEHAVRAIAAEIERYVEAHPGAADTAEGIQRWWLSRQLADESAAMVADALADLIARGVIVSNTLPDGRTLFAAPRGRVRE